MFFSTSIAKCVFISHKKEDAAAAESIGKYLTDVVGVNIYLDSKDLVLQEAVSTDNDKKIVESIKRGLACSTHLLCVTSEKTRLSWWVPYEIGIADDSGVAQHWIDNIAADHCNKREFVYADLLLCNYSLFGAYNTDNLPWFPITYVYTREDESAIGRLARQLKSKEVAIRWAKIFGYKSIEEIKQNMKQALESHDIHYWLRYNAAFEEPHLFTDYIKPDEIGTIN